MAESSLSIAGEEAPMELTNGMAQNMSGQEMAEMQLHLEKLALVGAETGVEVSSKDKPFATPTRPKSGGPFLQEHSPHGVDALYDVEDRSLSPTCDAPSHHRSRADTVTTDDGILHDNSDSDSDSGDENLADAWSSAIDLFVDARSAFKAVTHLRRLGAILDEIDEEDRFRFCKPDFLTAIDTIRNECFQWWDQLCPEIIALQSLYFDESDFRFLPTDLIQEIFLWIPFEQFSPVLQVCSEWNTLGSADRIWETFYIRKFVMNNPGSLPTTGLDRGFHSLFQTRLSAPIYGDRVEVAWRGKFRLNANETYHGLAWWVAEVVDVHEEQDRYKIRYLGWDAQWDDWISRSRLRWAVQPNIVERIRSYDRVELWCVGSNVPGAWLETRVKKVKGDRYYMVKDNGQGGAPWVGRDRLRLVCRSTMRERMREKAVANLSAERAQRAMANEAEREAAAVDEARPTRRSSLQTIGSFGKMISRRIRRTISGPPTVDATGILGTTGTAPPLQLAVRSTRSRFRAPMTLAELEELSLLRVARHQQSVADHHTIMHNIRTRDGEASYHRLALLLGLISPGEALEYQHLDEDDTRATRDAPVSQVRHVRRDEVREVRVERRERGRNGDRERERSSRHGRERTSSQMISANAYLRARLQGRLLPHERRDLERRIPTDEDGSGSENEIWGNRWRDRNGRLSTQHMRHPINPRMVDEEDELRQRFGARRSSRNDSCSVM